MVKHCMRRAWIIWAVAALFYAYEFFLRISPTVMVPNLMHAFKVDAATLGALSAFYYYAYASLQIPVGMMLDRFGIRRLLTIAAICVALGSFAFSHTHQLWVAEFGRILTGMGSAFAFISTVKLARNWFNHRWLAVVIGFTNTLGVMGAIAGEAPLAIVVNSIGWREALFVAGCIGALLALLITLIVRDSPETMGCPVEGRPEDKAIMPNFWRGLSCVLRNPKTWLVAGFAGLMVAPISAFTELWSVPFLMQAHHVTRPEAALLATAMFVGIACGGPFHGWWSGRLGSRLPVLKLGALGALLSLAAVLYLTISSMVVLVALLFLFGFFTSSMLLCFAINSEDNPMWATGVVIGFTNMLVMAGGALFQPLVGHFLDVLAGASTTHLVSTFTTGEFRIALSVLPVCNVLALVAVYFIKEDKT
jgi:sugar phosphate permease